MAEQLRPGNIVPESGVYRVTHEPAHIGALSQVTFIRGRQFPSCPHCPGIGFELLHSDELDWRIRPPAELAAAALACQNSSEVPRCQRERSARVNNRPLGQRSGLLFSLGSVGPFFLE